MIYICTLFYFSFEAGNLVYIEGNTAIKMLEGRGGEQEKYGTGEMCLRKMALY